MLSNWQTIWNVASWTIGTLVTRLVNTYKQGILITLFYRLNEYVSNLLAYAWAGCGIEIDLISCLPVALFCMFVLLSKISSMHRLGCLRDGVRLNMGGALPCSIICLVDCLSVRSLWQMNDSNELKWKCFSIIQMVVICIQLNASEIRFKIWKLSDIMTFD